MSKQILIALSCLFIYGTAYSKGRHISSVSETLCGVNKPSGEKIRLDITYNVEDEFSAPVIQTINGNAPAQTTPTGAAGFGPKGYEHIDLALTSTCSGSATYSHFNAQVPINPMEDLALKCVCKSNS